MSHDEREQGIKTDLESVDASPSLDREEDFHERQVRMTAEALDEAERARAELDEEGSEKDDDVIQPAFRVYVDEPDEPKDQGRFAQVRASVTDALESAKQTISEKVSDLKERAEEAIEGIKEKVSQRFSKDGEPESK